MTTFKRSGFYRTSKLGKRHWVVGHYVDRDYWERSSYAPNNHSPDVVLDRAGVLRSRSARFVSSNATCPVCGAHVWYYQNEYGSRVFFDDIGWPWPKHPCTDNNGSYSIRAERPEERTAVEVERIDAAAENLGFDLDRQFVERHGRLPWKLTVVAKSFRSQAANLIVARSLEYDGDQQFYFSFEARRRLLKPGDFFSFKRDRISLLDVTTLAPREIRIRRYRSVREFLDLIPSK